MSTAIVPAARAGFGKREITLRDRLSRLTYLQACKLLGPEGEQLIRRGGACEIEIDQDVRLGPDFLRLSLDGTVVTIAEAVEVPKRLSWTCTRCEGACEHVGAAFSLILEEKIALGLAVQPPERTPLKPIDEGTLEDLAVAERMERAQDERMRVHSANRDELWTDYLVTNAASGKTYRVALRGWAPGDSYCSCPDFRKNTLGLCKHILRVQQQAKRHFSADTRRSQYSRKTISVHLRYGKELELRMLLPSRLSRAVEQIVHPVKDRPIEDIHDLLQRIAKLEALHERVHIYPDAEEHIHSRLLRERIAGTVAAIRAAPERHPLRTQLLKVPLLPYQLDGIAFAVGAGRAILADDMGLGKTIQAIGVAELLARETAIGRVLVVCPTSVKSQWRNEIRRFSDRDCQLVIGSATERVRQYGNSCFFTICNYEQVLRDVLAIENVKWDLIILDEGQRIKNWEAKTSRVIKALKSPFALVLSGTPLENRLDDLFSVVEFIDDRHLGPAFRFYHRHRVIDERGRVLGYAKLGDLRRRLKPVLLRRTRAAVMKDLPPRSTEIVRVAPTAEQVDLHVANLRIVSSIVRKPFINEMDLLRLRKALLMCRMSADSTFLVDKRVPGYSSKLEALDDLLGSLLVEDDRKILLFSEWTTMLGLIEPLICKRGVNYVRLDGSIPQKQRQQLVHRFQHSPDCRLFIATNAGATGLNLQAANTVVNVDLPWNPAVLEQRIGRAHRMGQERPVQIFVLVTEGTIEENLLATLSAKHELALASLDSESEVDSVDLVSGMDELKSRLEVLLGATPEAPVDESEKARQAGELERVERQRNLARAGGQVLSAAVAFLGELFPTTAPDSPEVQQLKETVRRRLAECVEQEDGGGLKLTLSLPDPAALDNLASSLARFLTTTTGTARQSAASGPAVVGRDLRRLTPRGAEAPCLQ